MTSDEFTRPSGAVKGESRKIIFASEIVAEATSAEG
jgi:hypothetical protein